MSDQRNNGSLTGVRITWDDVPERVRGEIERRAGAAVVGEESKVGSVKR